jgi:type I restriction enzyme, S subunit
MGQSPPSSSYNNFGEGLPFFQGKAEFGDLYPKINKFCNKPQKISNPGDILISVRAPVGPTNICKEISCIGRGLASLRPKGEISAKYLFYFMRNIEPWLSTQGTGSTFSAISRRDLEQIEFLLAPLNEQKRIVAKLEKLLAKVDDCKERLEKIPAILKRFRQSVLAAACSGELTADWRKEHRDIETSEDLLKRIKQEKEENQDRRRIAKKKGAGKTALSTVPDAEPEIPSSWVYALSFDLFTFVTSGSRGWAKYYAPEGAKFIRIGNLAHDTIDLNLPTIQHVIPPDGSEGVRTRIQKNDILVSITADTGMIGLIQEDIGEAYINQHIALSRPVKGLDARYLSWFLTSKQGQEQFKALQRGATKAGLGLDDIKRICVPLPPIEEQKEIISRVEALFKIADAVESRYLRSVFHINRLAQSILAKAFRGELVPQDPKDEPASELLKRIKADRERSKKELKTRKGKRREIKAL